MEAPSSTGGELRVWWYPHQGFLTSASSEILRAEGLCLGQRESPIPGASSHFPWPNLGCPLPGCPPQVTRVSRSVTYLPSQVAGPKYNNQALGAISIPTAGVAIFLICSSDFFRPAPESSLVPTCGVSFQPLCPAAKIFFALNWVYLPRLLSYSSMKPLTYVYILKKQT